MSDAIIGSSAALAQSAIGNVASGSLFANAQSAAAGGAGAVILGGSVFAITSAVTWAISAPLVILGLVKERNKESSNEQEHEAEEGQKKKCD
jgi:hypothetical protein